MFYTLKYVKNKPHLQTYIKKVVVSRFGKIFSFDENE